MVLDDPLEVLVMEKVVIGLIGTIGSGKDTVSDYLIKKHKFLEVSIGDLVREAAKSKKLKLTRDNLQHITKSYKKRYGSDYWSKKAVKKILRIKSNKIILNGIRSLSDLTFQKRAFKKNFFLVLVDAKPSIRFERMRKRKRPGDPKTLSEFKRQEKNEYKLYGNFEKTLKKADFKINNNYTVKETYNQTSKLLKKLLPS